MQRQACPFVALLPLAWSAALVLPCPGAAQHGETQQKKDAAKPPRGWHQFTSKEGGFRVSLIGKPAPRPIHKRDGITWVSGVELARGQATSVGFYDLEVGAGVPAAVLNKEWQEILLEQFASGLAKDPKAKPANLRKVTVGDFPGLDGTSGGPGEATVLRYIMVGKRFFVLTVEARTEGEAKAVAAPFFASFDVLPELARRADVTAPAWERFTLPDAKVSVFLPGKPSLEEGKGPEDLGQGRMKTWTSYHPKQAIILLAVVVEVPPAVRKQLSPEAILDRYGEKGGRPITLGKYSGREWQSTKESKQREVMRAFVIGDRVVAVGVLDMNATSGARRRDTAQFLDSLRLESD
jgi:hypothetical protein